MFKIQKGLLESTDPLKFVNDLSNEAVGVYSKLGLCSAVSRLDGVVTFQAMDDVNASEQAQDELLDAGLLVMTESHFQLTGWEEHQTTAAQLSKQAEATRVRMRRMRERRAAKAVTPSQEPDVTRSRAELGEEVTPSHIVTPLHKPVQDDVTPSQDEEQQAESQSCFSEEQIDSLPADDDDTAGQGVGNDATPNEDADVYGADKFKVRKLEVPKAPVAKRRTEEYELDKAEEAPRGRRDFSRDSQPRMSEALQPFDAEEIELLFRSLEDYYPQKKDNGNRVCSAFKKTIRKYDPEDILVAAKQYANAVKDGRADLAPLKEWLVDKWFLDEKVFTKRSA